MLFLRALLSRWWPLTAVVIGSAGFLLYSLYGPCTPVAATAPVPGSQGYRIWSGPTLQSFEHTGAKICVPEGWEAVGAQEAGEGWARFPHNLTGILIKNDAFPARSIEAPGTGYMLTLRYPVATSPSEVERYAALLKTAFTDAAALFPIQTETALPHTLLVTAGLAGNTVDDGTRVYPDPSARATMLVRTPDQTRGNELLVHAATHAYNRFRPELRAYLRDQAPLSPEDFEELEGTWAEFALTNDAVAHRERFDYLYTIHEVVRGEREIPQGFIVTSEAERAALRQGLPLPEQKSYVEEQYGHYVLAPLVMLGIEGLLIASGSDASVASLLRETHAKGGSFLDRVEGVAGPAGRARVDAWLRGAETIPRALAEAAIASYAR